MLLFSGLPVLTQVLTPRTKATEVGNLWTASVSQYKTTPTKKENMYKVNALMILKVFFGTGISMWYHFVFFKASFEVLSSDYLDAVYDFTITYSMANENHFPRKPAPTMSGMCCIAV